MRDLWDMAEWPQALSKFDDLVCWPFGQHFGLRQHQDPTLQQDKGAYIKAMPDLFLPTFFIELTENGIIPPDKLPLLKAFCDDNYEQHYCADGSLMRAEDGTPKKFHIWKCPYTTNSKEGKGRR